ncbi:MAG: DUF58 domain-containing protein, partial [Deltaproteobacteria bacterium]|nr:DUF58 domain-containing protein [Deltaproteobacteria bacterium]
QGDEIKELRDYRSSDPMKWVDWKSSARKGALVVREFYRLQGDRLTLDLSRRDSHWERRVSEACHLVIEGERNRLSLVLLLPEGTIGPGSGPQHRRRLLEALALA